MPQDILLRHWNIREETFQHIAGGVFFAVAHVMFALLAAAFSSLAGYASESCFLSGMPPQLLSLGSRALGQVICV